ncbi:hypothetical protein Acr_03g0001190 [Actinidia rufa]|uniref:Uncharacterized protein n=1 Tax=Actinidia rufa TaxID=165716 RepID=A0A7J0E9T7_9ERIC|nr:hypothetical protein Acr_03g0000070 [Actinidia rufa]GFY83345.1 hypothetical protein Acr_03g0001190 [Actinidia rufa]
MEKKKSNDGSAYWTNERHMHYLSSMEASFVRTMLENNGHVLRLDRTLPDSSESTLDLKLDRRRRYSTSEEGDRVQMAHVSLDGPSLCYSKCRELTMHQNLPLPIFQTRPKESVKCRICLEDICRYSQPKKQDGQQNQKTTVSAVHFITRSGASHMGRSP